MVTAASEPVRIDDTISGAEYRDHLFFEGSSIRKIDNTYYFIYSTINNHELCYATTKRPDGGFTFGGTIISNGDIGYKGRLPKDRLNHTGRNHGSIEKVSGQWYVFYHRLTHNSDYSRQVCAKRIETLPDGSIPQVEMTSCGLNGRPLQGGTYPAVICCNLTNGHMSHGSNSKKRVNEPCVTSRNGERFITGIADGTSITYKYFSLNGIYRLVLSTRGAALVCRTNFGNKIHINGSDTWANRCVEFSVKEGIYPLTLTFDGKGTAELNQITIQR